MATTHHSADSEDVTMDPDETAAEMSPLSLRVSMFFVREQADAVERDMKGMHEELALIPNTHTFLASLFCCPAFCEVCSRIGALKIGVSLQIFRVCALGSLWQSGPEGNHAGAGRTPRVSE